FKLTWEEALALTAVAGAIFLALSVVGFRSQILNAIPDALKSGIAAGIGLFIALIGFEWGNLVRPHPVTCLALESMADNYEALLTLVGLGVTLALAAFRVRGAVLIGILVTTAATWGLGRLSIRPDLGLTVEQSPRGVEVVAVGRNSAAARAGVLRRGDVITTFNDRDVADAPALQSAAAAAAGSARAPVQFIRSGEPQAASHPLTLSTVHYQGVVGRPSGLRATAGGLFGGFGSLWGKLVSGNWSHVLAFAFIILFMDMFDTVGTLVGVAKRAGLMQDGHLPKAERALAADAAGTVAGAALGTSTVTSYIESITGVAAGARTGVAAIVAGLCMLAALLFQPLVEMVGGGVRVGTDAFGDPVLRYPMIAPALILVGSLMIRAIRDVEWDDVTEAIPAFLAMVTMPFAYSISAGIAIGFISYAFGKLVTGRVRECPILVYVFAALFVVQYVWAKGVTG
ncbi:MAG TPA: solute carrier family 23 protein, partial [Phycisphaerae bacterium]|nr:solute carrier family 23 protein [Phycisphaerae bacterium]